MNRKELLSMCEAVAAGGEVFGETVVTRAVSILKHLDEYLAQQEPDKKDTEKKAA